ncbi:MAG TPA: putative metal-dependent hydrolase [Saprospiraceae bacterium]|nr:putative metal-dependent hydrolase [Saprospiraceae bacterium]
MAEENLKFPIGRFVSPGHITTENVQSYLKDISTFPQRLREEVHPLTDAQLDTPYREGGWTVRQVVHHLADSHMNSLMRFKLALTEENPTIKPYFEERWAELADSKQMPIEPALKMLEGIHARWAFLIQHVKPALLQSTFVHPQHGKVFRLDENLGLYAWHGNHHLAHITALKIREGWK